MTGHDRPTVLVVDDEALIRQWLTEVLLDKGFSVVGAASGAEALQSVEASDPALVLLDLRLPDANGIDLLPQLLEIDRDLVVAIITAHGEISTAVEAVKAGAHDFLEKPLDLDKLTLVLERGLEARRLRQQVSSLRQLHSWRFADVELVGRSAAMQSIVDTVRKLSETRATVLLQGESGTGKDLIAQAIHAQSPRRDHPFLEVNCTALADQLVESELFGHERGAFTDARQRKKGLVELATGGTLFLDEMGDMRLETQAKILRFLENSKFRRVGGTADIQVDVRVIAATNRDLQAMVDQGKFRSDLYFRLKVLPMTIPPLRERKEDIEPLARYFTHRLARELRREPATLSDDATKILERYSWPGNVRQLKNVLERMMILHDTPTIEAEHLPVELIHETPQGRTLEGGFAMPPEGLNLEELERDLIRQAIARTRGNVTEAARLLGLSRDTLRYRLDKYGIRTTGAVVEP